MKFENFMPEPSKIAFNKVVIHATTNNFRRVKLLSNNQEIYFHFWKYFVWRFGRKLWIFAMRKSNSHPKDETQLTLYLQSAWWGLFLFAGNSAVGNSTHAACRQQWSDSPRLLLISKGKHKQSIHLITDTPLTVTWEATLRNFQFRNGRDTCLRFHKIRKLFCLLSNKR